jgi:hypothetical protein
MPRTTRKTTLTVFAGVLAVLVVLVLTGCGKGPAKKASSSSEPRAVAVVSGTLGIFGGEVEVRPSCGCIPAAGTVRLTNAHGHRIDVKTNKSGKFSVRVPAGRYRVVAGLNHPYDWPMGSCTGLRGTDVHFVRGKHKCYYLAVGNEKRLHIYVGCIAL